MKYHVNETFTLNVCLCSIKALTANILRQWTCTCNVFQVSQWIRFRIIAFLDSLWSWFETDSLARPWRKYIIYSRLYYLFQRPDLTHSILICQYLYSTYSVEYSKSNNLNGPKIDLHALYAKYNFDIIISIIIMLLSFEVCAFIHH